ncbi:MAG: PriCT-2 domain-containing protein [Candidatus Sedimenticola sp. (ex Thyasira tokunagai)]
MTNPATTSHQDEIWSALSTIPADGRETWVKVGMAIKSELGDAGFSLWDGWSQSAGNYSERAARDVWCSFKDGSIKIATLFHLAKENGWNAFKASQKPKPRPKVAPTPLKQSTGIYARELWLKSSWKSVASHPYAIAKGIDWYAGAARGKASGRVIGLNADCIVVPVRDLSTDRVVAVQAINSNGDKQTFGNLSGNAFICGNTLDLNIPWFVVEGWADAISLVFHHFRGNAAAFAACGKSMMPIVANQVAEVFKPDEVTILEDAA